MKRLNNMLVEYLNILFSFGIIDIIIIGGCMRKHKKKKTSLFLILILFGITIGFAALNSNLSIDGISRINNASWEIYFDHIQVKDGSISIGDGNQAATINSQRNTVTYNITFSKPGEFYEFTVDVVNAGSIDGMIETITSTINGNPITTLPAYLNYSVTYEDGLAIAPNQILSAHSTETYKVRVDFRTDINPTDLPSNDQSFSFAFGVKYIQVTDDVIDMNSVMIPRMMAKNVSQNNTIDFSKKSPYSDSDLNGQGIQIYDKDTYGVDSDGGDLPIYYYRGAVDDNNVEFGGFCWKILRTTSTGGTKLIYNGSYSDSKKCTSPSFDSNLQKRRWGNDLNSFGYMYGVVPDLGTIIGTYSYDYYFGSDFTFDSNTGLYSLVDLVVDPKDGHRYSCRSKNINGTCERIEYFFITNYTSRSIYLENGDGISDFVSKLNENVYDSAIKTALENWYADHLLSYSSYIEDSYYCNDRTVGEQNSFNPEGPLVDGVIFDAFYRTNPTLSCSKNDAFSVSESSKKNGNSNYPIGLITVDEVLLAGADRSSTNKSFYLYTSYPYWTMSPAEVSNDYGGSIHTSMQLYNENGVLDHYGYCNGACNNNRLRPVITIKAGTVISSDGDGTVNNPYHIVTN